MIGPDAPSAPLVAPPTNPAVGPKSRSRRTVIGGRSRRAVSTTNWAVNAPSSSEIAQAGSRTSSSAPKTDPTSAPTTTHRSRRQPTDAARFSQS